MSNYHRQPIPYPAASDYGSRRGYPTLSVVFHMAEGTNVAQYLSRSPLRGVSVHYTIEQKTTRWKDGEVVRCLPEGRISGSINPDTIRRDNDGNGYYGVSHNRFGLGSYWTNPNVAVLSVEVAGRAKTGPTKAQQASMVALFQDIERRYDRVVPLAHRDFQNVKPCPGQTAGIRAAFSGMGGHGKQYNEVRFMSTRGYVPGRVCDLRDGARLFNYPGAKPFGEVSGDDLQGRSLLGYSPAGRDFALVETTIDGQPQRTAWVRTQNISNVREAPTGDCSAARAAGRSGGLEDAEAAVAAVER